MTQPLLTSFASRMELVKIEAWKDMINTVDIDETKYRGYQLDVIKKIEDFVKKGIKDIGVIVPTGAGKSHVMGTLQLRLKIIRYAVLCHYTAITESNSEFFRKSTASPVEKIVQCGYISNTQLAGLETYDDDLFSVDTHATNKTQKTPFMLFAGINRFLTDAKYIDKFNIIAIDEPQLSMSAVNKVRENNPNAVIIYFTAFPPTDLLELCGPNLIEILHKDIQDQLKIQTLANISSRSEIIRGENRDSDLKDTAWLNQNVFNHHKIWKMNLTAAIDLLGAVAGINPDGGMIIKCGNVADCLAVATMLNEDDQFKKYNLKARAVAGKTATPNFVKKARTDYINGRIHVLVVCKMLAVGFHDTRTRVLVPLYATKNFQEFLQFFGRSTSKSGTRLHAYMVAMDLFWECNNFDQLYSQYCARGVANILLQSANLQVELEHPEASAPDNDDNEDTQVRTRNREYHTYPTGISLDDIQMTVRGVYDVDWVEMRIAPPPYRRRRNIREILDHDDNQDLSLGNKRPRTFPQPIADTLQSPLVTTALLPPPLNDMTYHFNRRQVITMHSGYVFRIKNSAYKLACLWHLNRQRQGMTMPDMARYILNQTDPRGFPLYVTGDGRHENESTRPGASYVLRIPDGIIKSLGGRLSAELGHLVRDNRFVEILPNGTAPQLFRLKPEYYFDV